MTIKDLFNPFDPKKFKELNDLLSHKGSAGCFYKSEAQFQFDFAWSIKEYLNQNKCENEPEVILEYFSAKRTDDSNKTKKFFTDIMIKDKKGLFVPIELKYKTKTVSRKPNDISIFDDFGEHGATDYGRFDYLWDLKRIQLLKNPDTPKTNIDRNPELEVFCGGYAIMLTNDEHYWKAIDPSKDPAYKMFCIEHGRTIKANDSLEWKDKGQKYKVNDTWRNDYNYVVPFVFDEDHLCDWKPYSTDPEFKYLMLSVKP